MNQFKLTSIGNNDTSVEVTFNFIEKNNCFDISLSYKYSDDLNTLEKQKHFMSNQELYDSEYDSFYEGDIICKNPMTIELISLMMLSDSNLKTHSGHVTAESYRLSLIKMIKLLWD